MSELVVGSIAGLAANDYVVSVASGSKLTQPGMVLQVVSAAYSTETAIASTSYVDTGLTASITPSSASSKILVMVTQPANVGDETTNGWTAQQNIVRDSTQIFESKIDGRSRTDALVHRMPFGGALTVLDSPATTSSVTYKTQGLGDANVSNVVFQPSNSGATITLMEIAD